MESLSTELFNASLALVGTVILVSALLSGLIDRIGLPPVAVFLALGAALGGYGLGLINLDLDSPVLRIVATLSLLLVLFTDAVTLDVGEVRRHAKLALIILGPGTLLTAAVIAFAAWWLLGFSLPQAAILGAALASTDAVLLRGLLRRRDIPPTVRQALRLEGGLNDVVLLPIVLVAMLFLVPGASPGPVELGRLGVSLFLLGPGAGIAIGLVAVATLDMIRRRIGVRRDYESLYSIGTALTAFAAAETVGGSGFLAAFAAGLTISALDLELCDCFLEYGEATSEMLMLLTFVLFGSSLIWSGFTVINGATLLFAAIVLLGRMPIFLLSLIGSPLTWNERLMLGWFGPRGLSSLLIVLLPVFLGLPGSAELFAVCSLVVLLSVVLHGGSPLLLNYLPRPARRSAPPAAPEPITSLPATPQPVGHATAGAEPVTDQPAPLCDSTCSRNGQAADQPAPLCDGSCNRNGEADAPVAPPPEPGDATRISIDEVRALIAAGAPVVLVDVRSERSYANGRDEIMGALRLPPDHIAERAAELKLPHETWAALYCT